MMQRILGKLEWETRMTSANFRSNQADTVMAKSVHPLAKVTNPIGVAITAFPRAA
jgi:hypothetical protein